MAETTTEESVATSEELIKITIKTPKEQKELEIASNTQIKDVR